MQPSGWAGQTYLIASGKSSRAAYLNTTFQTLHNMATFENSGRQLTLEQLIYLQADSRVNLTAWRENEKAKTTSATCGPRCCALFENAPRATSWAKMFAALLVGMEGFSSKRCALTWKLVGTPYNRSYFQLQVSVLRIEEIASGLLLTPTTREEVMDTDKFKARMEKYDNGTTVPNLATQVVGMLPTPIAQESDKITGKENQDSLTKRARLITGKTSQLSPQFVEEMMGFPKNWTALPFQSGEENP